MKESEPLPPASEAERLAFEAELERDMAHQTLPPLPDLLPDLLARMGAPPQDAAARFWVLGGEAPRLVAGTAGGPEYSLSVRSAGAAGEAGYAIRYHADHGFLRVLIAAEAQGVAPPARFRLELLFPDAPPLSGISRRLFTSSGYFCSSSSTLSR